MKKARGFSEPENVGNVKCLSDGVLRRGDRSCPGEEPRELSSEGSGCSVRAWDPFGAAAMVGWALSASCMAVRTRVAKSVAGGAGGRLAGASV